MLPPQDGHGPRHRPGPTRRKSSAAAIEAAETFDAGIVPAENRDVADKEVCNLVHPLAAPTERGLLIQAGRTPRPKAQLPRALSTVSRQ